MGGRQLLIAICLAACGLTGGVAESRAEEGYVIGVSAGLTGYAAPLDRAWTDGVRLGAEMLNERGGILGKKLAVVVEDNKSQPQEAVTGYNKMISSDGRRCSSAAFCPPATLPRRRSSSAGRFR